MHRGDRGRRRPRSPGRGGEVLIRVGGRFDRAAAWRLGERLRRLPPSACVVIDFSRVTEFRDAGVPVMASRLAARGGQVVVRGLCQHQHRLFRYFGVDLDALRAPERAHAGPRG